MRYARWMVGMLAEITSNMRLKTRYTGPPVNAARCGGTAFVSGATGAIGEAVCRGLAERGFDEVLVGARDAARGDAVVERLRADFPASAARTVVADLATDIQELPRR